MGKKKILSYDLILTEEDKVNIIKDYVENFLSIRDLKSKYNIKSGTYLVNLLKGKIRNLSESNKVDHK